MAIAFTKINGFVQDLAEKLHNLNADTIAACLCPAASFTSGAATSTTFSAGSTDLATGNGYTQGGQSISTGSGGSGISLIGNTITFNATTAIQSAGVVWSCTSSTLTFRYVVIVNTTANRIIGYYDYGGNLTLNQGDQFTYTPASSGSGGIFQLS